MEMPIAPDQQEFLDYQNHTAVYDYFSNLPPDIDSLKRMHRIAGIIYRPRVRFAEGVEDAMLQDAQEGVSYIFASNHSRLDDQFPYASMMQRQEVFHGFIGNIVILSKIEHFNKPWKRKIVEKWSGIPVYRAQGVEANQDIDPRIVGQELQSTVVSKIMGGMSLFLFPEGTRKKKDGHEIGEVKKGIGKFACAAFEAGAEVAVLPMALFWGESDNKRWTRRIFRPDIYVDIPIRLQGDRDECVTDSLMVPIRKGMAHSLYMAKEASDKRLPTARLTLCRMTKGLKKLIS